MKKISHMSLQVSDKQEKLKKEEGVFKLETRDNFEKIEKRKKMRELCHKPFSTRFFLSFHLCRLELISVR